MKAQPSKNSCCRIVSGRLKPAATIHQAQAEFYILQGSLPAAIEQLQLAQTSGEGDFYELSVVDARLKELRAEHERELKEAKKR